MFECFSRQDDETGMEGMKVPADICQTVLEPIDRSFSIEPIARQERPRTRSTDPRVWGFGRRVLIGREHAFIMNEGYDTQNG
jgi:hypothetical protein